jgi:hypothetical protein
MAKRLHIITVTELVLHDQSFAGSLLEDKIEFVSPEAEIEIHQHDARFGGRELHKNPLRDIRRPDSDPVASLKAKGHQPSRGAFHLGMQLSPTQSYMLLAKDKSKGFGMALGHPVKNLPNAEIRKWRVINTSGVAGGLRRQSLGFHEQSSVFFQLPPEVALIVNLNTIRVTYTPLNFWNTNNSPEQLQCPNVQL